MKLKAITGTDTGAVKKGVTPAGNGLFGQLAMAMVNRRREIEHSDSDDSDAGFDDTDSDEDK